MNKVFPTLLINAQKSLGVILPYALRLNFLNLFNFKQKLVSSGSIIFPNYKIFKFRNKLISSNIFSYNTTPNK